jgi:3-oxoacyl-[acyl-carrier protein] reductase
MSNKIDLDGRCAIVTGGAQGIGRAIAQRFLDSGAAVAIWDRDVRLAEETAKALKARGRVVAFPSMWPTTRVSSGGAI